MIICSPCIKSQYTNYSLTNLNKMNKCLPKTSFGETAANVIKKPDNFYIANHGKCKSIEIYPIQYIEQYINPEVIQNAINENPDISMILDIYGLKPQIYMANINSDAKNHLFSTYMCAKDIAKNMSLSSAQSQNLYKAALLHDIGKALIPEEIIQKPGKLTPEERKIVNLHARLGYEILKTTDVPEDVANAVKTHHVPIIRKQDDLISQILSVADVYSALREERAYKPVLSKEKTFEIMSAAPELSQPIVNRLKCIQMA